MQYWHAYCGKSVLQTGGDVVCCSFNWFYITEIMLAKLYIIEYIFSTTMV